MWNYRVIDLTTESDEEPVLEICEVYYNDLGQCSGWCASTNMAEHLDEFRELVKHFLEALDKPILKLSDFIEQDDENY